MPRKSHRNPNMVLPHFVEGFEDLAPLFTNGYENRGLIRLNFNEAAFLWKTAVNSRKGGCIVEIGRAEGGSTILLAAAAIRTSSLVVSFDVDPVDDGALKKILHRLRLHAELHVADSQTCSTKSFEDTKLLFIDGDHSYEGVRRDFENWFQAVVRGGMIVFHDAIGPGSEKRGPGKFYKELLTNQEVAPFGGAGSMRAVVKV